MFKIVSVIIPCFNAEKWIKEAIDSCLNQRYPAIEIIVIDDGSNDNSLEIIKSYRDQIKWETGPNRGGNYARNRGFALSKGEYIQYLDADDYILPKKIENQVRFLEDTGADVVYSDWRHQRHLPNGRIILEDIKVSGIQADILESLLADWWVSPACLLFTRASVEKTGGWDENLKAGQDRDFFISVVMAGANVVYQAGCDSIYRRYGNITVSTSSKVRYLENHIYILEKVEQKLREMDNFSNKYSYALAQSYFRIARGYLHTDYSKYLFFLDKTLTLAPNFKAKSSDRTAIFNLGQNIFGFQNIESIVVFYKRMKALLAEKLNNINMLHLFN